MGTESTAEGLQARTSASRPIRFQKSSQPNLIGLEALVRACGPSVVLSVPTFTMKECPSKNLFIHSAKSQEDSQGHDGLVKFIKNKRSHPVKKSL